MQIVKVQNVLGVTVHHFDDGEPRIKDVDLAERLGYRKPAAIRELIGRLVRDGKLNDVALIRTARKNGPGRPSDEYHLTEAQALKVAAKSETETADQILDLLIEVFLRVKGGWGQSSPPAPPQLPVGIDQIAAMIKAAVADALPRLLAPAQGDGVVGHQEGAHIRAMLMRVAVIDADGDKRKALGRRTKLDNELRSRLKFFGSCRSWDNLPSGDLGVVKVLVEEAEKRARGEASRRNEARQGTLFRGPSDGA